MSNLIEEHNELILDGTKIQYHEDRVKAWERGERIAPITVDIALLDLVIMVAIFVMQCFKKMTEKNYKRSYL